MATEVSRTFDRAHGAVYLVVEDNYGVKGNHTIYVAMVPDVEARIAEIMTTVDSDAAVIHEKLLAAGWKPA